MAQKILPLGTSDFKAIIEEKLYYVDKTNLINDIINGARITLLPRPRRFGKTLNMSMLQYFFDNSADYRHLFNGLAIEQNTDAMKHCGQYPVIFLSFKDVKEPKAEDAFSKIAYLIALLFEQHASVFAQISLSEIEQTMVQAIRRCSCNPAELSHGIQLLSSLLHRHYQQNVVILIDEYDMPINHAYSFGYYDEMIGFMRNLLSGAFKDNACLFKGVMTGILRVARESIFSGLNNIDVCTLTNPRYAQHFGFTEAQTEQLLNDYHLTYELDAIRTWYNGYNFGEITIYNPWSIIHLAQNNGALDSYWLNTSDNEIVRNLIGKASSDIKQQLEVLLVDQNATIRKPLNENVSFRDIQRSQDALWNFLLFSGYLAYKNKALEGKQIYVDLCIPNMEVASFYDESILSWFEAGVQTNSYELSTILGYLLQLDFEAFCETFERMVADCFSYFDVSGQAAESFYHAFVLGMLVQLQTTHRIQSNRESGFGRYDVCLIPHDKTEPAFVFEFKKVNLRRGETLETACEAALQQIADKQYVAELHALGIETVYPVAMAFEGKRVLVRFGSDQLAPLAYARAIQKP